jgi:hypothetical protein
MAGPGGGSDDAQKEVKNNNFPEFLGNKYSPSCISYNEIITKYFTWVSEPEKTKHN